MNNTERFNGRAINYHLYRPEYPKEMYEVILRHFPANEQPSVADIGFGTGKSSVWLLRKGYDLTGIEPNASMFSVARQLQKDYPKLLLKNTTAEKTGLSKNSIDLIISGQAIQYFNMDKLRPEFSRILSKKGLVAIFWHRECQQSAFEERYYAIVNKYRASDSAQGRDLRETRDDKVKALFQGGHANFFRFRHHQVLDAPGLLGRTFSSSHAPKETSKSALALTNELMILTNGESEFRLNYEVHLHIGSINIETVAKYYGQE